MDLYYSKSSSPCRSILMASQVLGVELNKKLLNLQAGEHLTPEFLKINPQHTIPTLVDNGFVLWESRAILAYLADKSGKDDAFYPKCPQKRAVVNQRLYFDMGTLYKSYADYFYPQCIQKTPADPEKLKKLEEAIELLDIFLKDNTYVTGENLTVADVAILASMTTFHITGVEFKRFANVTKWYEHCKKTVPGYEENWEGSKLFAQKWKDIKDGKIVYPVVKK